MPFHIVFDLDKWIVSCQIELGKEALMKSVLYIVPLRPGMLKAYQAFGAEITGPRKQEFAALLKRYGLKSSKVWCQKLGDREYMMIYHDTEEDARERLKTWADSTHPFDRWFGEECHKCYEGFPEEAQLIFDFDGEF